MAPKRRERFFRIICDIRWFCAALWMLFMAYHTSHGSPWSNLLSNWLPAGFFHPDFKILAGHGLRLMGLIGLSALLAGSGQTVLLRTKIRAHNAWEALAFAYGIGYGLWATILLLLGLAGLWFSPLLAGLLIGASLPAAQGIGSLQESLHRERNLFPKDRLSGLCAVLFLCIWLLYLPSTLIPETFYDAQGYHLGLPGLYLQHHRIIPTPENSYSAIPSIPMMMYGWTLALDKWGMLAQLLHASSLLWIGVGLVGLCRRLNEDFGKQAGWLAALIFASTPVVISESFRVSVGLEWALFQLLCFHALLSASEAPESQRSHWLCLSGLFLGFAMSTKYPAWILPGTLAAGMLYCRQNGLCRFTLRDGALLLGAGLLILSPWVLRNISFYENPIFPFYQERSAPDFFYKPNWTYLSSGSLDLKRVFFTAAGLKKFFLQPWEFSRHVRDVGGAIGPVYLGALPALLFLRRPKRTGALAVLTLAAWLPINAVSWITRFFIPVLAPLCALIALGLFSIEAERARKWMAAALGCALLSTSLSYLSLGVKRWKNYDVLMGSKSRWEYLTHVNQESFYPTPPHAGFKFLHDKTKKSSKILLFGEARHFPLWRDHIASSADQVSILELWANASETPRELRERFEAAGVDYVLVNHAEIFRNQTRFEFTVRGKRVLDEFWKKYALRELQDALRNDYWVEVYRILSEDEAAQPHPFHDLWAAYQVKK